MPIEFWGKWTGGAIVPDGKSSWEAVKKLHPHERLRVVCSKPRNYDRHRLYFAVIDRAFDNWPEQHEFRAETSEHLRHFLQIKAGYKNVETHELDMASPEKIALSTRVILASALQKPYPFVRSYGDKVAIFTSKSIDYGTLDEAAFKPVLDAVFSVIEAELGVSIEQMKAEVAMGDVA